MRIFLGTANDYRCTAIPIICRVGREIRTSFESTTCGFVGIDSVFKTDTRGSLTSMAAGSRLQATPRPCQVCKSKSGSCVRYAAGGGSDALLTAVPNGVNMSAIWQNQSEPPPGR